MITIYHLELNGSPCRLYWCEVGGVESYITGLSRVEYTSCDPSYYDDCVIEEWVTTAVIEGTGKDEQLIDDNDHVVIDLKRISTDEYFKE